jgi:eukaryotic-like serine/threonine-protein kinase
MQSLVGQVVGRYKIVEELGRGGMAVVYHAQDAVLGRSVALKMILPNQQHSEKFLRRFIREAKTLAQLSHSNIVKVLDYGEHQGTPFLVMEYIPRGTLDKRMTRLFSYSEAAALLAPIARALHHAHQHRVIHRDVKPANILINESGQPMLSDFGIVKITEADESMKLTGTGIPIGTPSYMSPEQIQGRPVDARTDIYALAVIFFELVTGRKPYWGNSAIEITLKHLNDPVPKVRQIIRDLPAEVDQLIQKGMAKKPEDRFSDMSTFAAELERLAAQSKGKVRPSAQKPARQTAAVTSKKAARTPLVVVGAIAALSLVIFSYFAWGRDIFPIGSVNPTRTGLAAALETSTSTPTPTEPAEADTPTPTRTVTASTATITATSKPSPTAAAAGPEDTQTPESNSQIRPDNLDKVIELKWIDKISVIKMEWTADGSHIVNVGSKAIILIDPGTMQITQSITLGNEIPEGMALMPDGERVAILASNQVFIYNLSGSREQVIQVNGGASSIAVSPDGAMFALSMRDNRVQIINTEDGHVMRSPLRSNSGGWAAAFSPDGKLLAVGTSQGVLMWEIEAQIPPLRPVYTGQEYLIKSLAFSHDGAMLAGGGENIIIVWKVDTGEELVRFNDRFGYVNQLQFSPSDQLLVSGTDDASVRIWDLAEQREGKSLKNHLSAVYGVVFSPNGEWIASGANEGYIRLWGIP